MEWKEIQPWAKSMFPHHKDSKGNLKYVHVKISKTKNYYSVQYYDKTRTGKNKVIHVGAFDNPHVAGLAYSLFCAFLLQNRKDHVMMMERLINCCTRPCLYMNGLIGEDAALKELNKMKDEGETGSKRRKKSCKGDETKIEDLHFPFPRTTFSTI